MPESGLFNHRNHSCWTSRQAFFEIHHIGAPGSGIRLNSSLLVSLSRLCVKSELIFRHAGTSVSVVGVVAGIAADGNISATYTIDHNAPALRFIPKDTLEGMPMTELFHAAVEAGTHTLVVNVTQIAPPMALGIDFISYNASFENLASMPGHSPTSDTSSLGSSQSKVPAGAIVGGVLGGVALLAVMLLGTFIWRRRQSARVNRKDTWSGENVFWSSLNIK